MCVKRDESTITQSPRGMGVSVPAASGAHLRDNRMKRIPFIHTTSQKELAQQLIMWKFWHTPKTIRHLVRVLGGLPPGIEGRAQHLMLLIQHHVLHGQQPPNQAVRKQTLHRPTNLSHRYRTIRGQAVWEVEEPTHITRQQAVRRAHNVLKLNA